MHYVLHNLRKIGRKTKAEKLKKIPAVHSSASQQLLKLHRTFTANIINLLLNIIVIMDEVSVTISTDCQLFL